MFDSTSLDTSRLERFVAALMDMGEAMVTSGGEVSRTEDTLSRLAAAYGAVRADVFAINSVITASFEFPGAREFTLVRRITVGESTDMTRLEQLNQLSRSFTADPREPEELCGKVREILSKKPRRLKTFVGSMLAAAAFTLFFGGSLADAAATLFFAALVWLMSEHLAPVCPNRITFNFLAALISGLLIGLLAAVFPVFSRDNIAIGTIMLLIPGLALTNALRNILVGDTISGSTRCIEAILWAGSIAGGFILAMLVV
ncbi:MAG: threonine/serine exporter family protein [Clostridia bacterium]|nr:threonine/serine exporter family protein [Clostridia bacterium]